MPSLIAIPLIFSPLAGALLSRWAAAGALLVFILYTRLFDMPLARLALPRIWARGVTASELCIAGLLVIVLARRTLVRREQNLVAKGWPWLLIGVYVGITFLGAFWAPDRGRAIDQTMYLIRDVVLVFIVVEMCDTPASQRVALWSLLVAGSVLAGLSVFQSATHTYDNSYLGLAHAEIGQIVGLDHDYRVGGPVGDANFYALILTALLPVAVLRARDEWHPALRLIALGCAVLLVTGIVLTYSRGALVALACIVVCWILVARVRRKVLIVLAVVVVAGAALVPTNYWERLASTTLSNYTVQSRIRSQQIALAIFLDHPLFGTGTDSYMDVYQDYAARLNLPGAATSIHNTYLAIAAENGLAGLAPFAAALLVILRRARRGRNATLRAGESLAEGRILACLLALSTYLIGIIFLPLAYPRYLWLLAGLTLVVSLPAEEPGKA